MSLTAAEIVAHPAFNTVIWPLKPNDKGTCAVAHGRGGPIDIAYEIHGTGPIRLVVSSCKKTVARHDDMPKLRDEASGSWVSAPSNGTGKDKP